MRSPMLEMRNKLSLSQYQFALVLGVCRSHISEVERSLCSLSGRDIRGLSGLHFDTDELVTLQNEFVEHTRGELRRQIANHTSDPEGEG